jgi:hypothetical protein
MGKEGQTNREIERQTDGLTDLNLIAAFCIYVKELKKIFRSSKSYSSPFSSSFLHKNLIFEYPLVSTWQMNELFTNTEN